MHAERANWLQSSTSAHPRRPLQVADLIKSDRLNRLTAVVNRVAEERAQRFAGRDLEVLVEGPNPRAGSTVRGWVVVGGGW